VDATSGAIVAVNIIVLLSQAGFLLVVSVVVVDCPLTTKAIKNKQVETSNSFFEHTLVPKIGENGLRLPIIFAYDFVKIRMRFSEK
jgi:hypothetical protein